MNAHQQHHQHILVDSTQKNGQCGVQKKQEQKTIVPFSYLLSRDLQNQRIPRPVVRFGHCMQTKKGEDFVFIKPDCQRIPGDTSSGFSVFAVRSLPVFFDLSWKALILMHTCYLTNVRSPDN